MNRQGVAEAGSRGRVGFRTVKSILPEVVNRIDELYNSKGMLTGIPTGFKKLDEMTSGLQPGDLVGAFDVEKCGGAVNDGKEVGANFCYRCMLGNKPVVMVFARKADKSLVSLIKELDKTAAEWKATFTKYGRYK